MIHAAPAIRHIAGRARHDLLDPTFVKQMFWVLIFWGLTIITLLNNINFLNTHYPNPVAPNDIILDYLPETDQLDVIGDAVGFTGMLMMGYIMWQEHFKRLPKLLFLLAAMYMLRGFAILLTPLKQIQPPADNFSSYHFVAQHFYYGMFFSGHTASAFLQVFFIKGHPLRPFAAMIATLQVFTLLASHSHYSIDIFGGFFVAYFFAHVDLMACVPQFMRDIPWMPWNEVKDEENQFFPGFIYAVSRYFYSPKQFANHLDSIKSQQLNRNYPIHLL